MTPTTLPGGTFTLADDLTLTRMGYGAMQLAGPHVFGRPPTATGRSRSCVKSSSLGSLILTPATSTARTSPIN